MKTKNYKKHYTEKERKDRLEKFDRINYPKIDIEGNIYYQIACKKCVGDLWEVFSNKKDFYIKCLYCGNLTKINIKNIKRKPSKKWTW